MSLVVAMPREAAPVQVVWWRRGEAVERPKKEARRVPRGRALRVVLDSWPRRLTGRGEEHSRARTGRTCSSFRFARCLCLRQPGRPWPRDSMGPGGERLAARRRRGAQRGRAAVDISNAAAGPSNGRFFFLVKVIFSNVN